MVDLTKYRYSEAERLRTNDLLQLIPDCGGKVLDVGAREGHFSRLLTESFDEVVALDLKKPSIEHPKIKCIKGDASCLYFDDNYFDLVFCAEVLEHIPYNKMLTVCSELKRVSNKYILIGVPYKQDTRVGRTTCYSCGKKNPAWGHVNSFDLNKLICLFHNLDVIKISYVGNNKKYSNCISSFLMELSGNPYGTYNQEEPCIFCGKSLSCPPKSNFCQKIITKAAIYTRYPTNIIKKSRPNWVHVLFRKRN